MAVGGKVGEAYIELTAKMAKFESQLRSAKMLTGKATAKMQTGMKNVAVATKGTTAAMKLLKVAIGAISFIAIAMAFKKIVQATAQFEDAQLELRKTSGMTREEIDKFSGRIKHMASVMPTSTTGLLEIAAAAARLGIQGSDNLANFSETVIKMATATQYTTEQASLDFAKIATVMKLPYSEIGRLGSAMNELANTTTATAPIIGDFTRRVAGAGKTLGLTIPQLTAMGATLDSLGVTTQVAGTAMSNFFTKMLTKAQVFADQAGMAVKDWNRLVEVDAYEALQKWLSAMDQMKPIERAQALGELGMEGARMTDTLMKLSGAQELLNVNLATAEKAFKENTSLEKEYRIALEGLSAQWNIFTGNVINLAITIGTRLSPALKEIMKGLNVLIDGIQFFINNWTQVWKAAYQILVETLKHMGKIIWKSFTDPSVFKATLNLYIQFWKTVLMTAAHTMEMLRDVIARVLSIIWAPLIKSLQWVADNIVYYFKLGMELARNAVFKGINVIGDAIGKGFNTIFGPILEKLGIDMQKALTFEIPESTLKQPKKFADRMGEAWKIIKEQYAAIPGDLQKYVDDLAMEWENVTRAAGEFGEAADWGDYKNKIAGIIEELKALGVDTSALEKEQGELNKTLDKTHGLLQATPGVLGKVITKFANYKTAIANLGAPMAKAYTGLFLIEGLLKSIPGALGKVIPKFADYKTAITNLGAPMATANTNLLTFNALLPPMPGDIGKVVTKLVDYKTAITNINAPMAQGNINLLVLLGKIQALPGPLVKVKDKMVDWIGEIRNLGTVTIETQTHLFTLLGTIQALPGPLVKVKDKTVDWIGKIRSLGVAIIETNSGLRFFDGLLRSIPGPLVKVKDKTVNWLDKIRELGAATIETHLNLLTLDGLLQAIPGPLIEVKDKTVDWIGKIRELGAATIETQTHLFTLLGTLQDLPGPLVEVKDKTVDYIGKIKSLGAATIKTQTHLFTLLGTIQALPGPLVEIKNKTDDYIGAIRDASPMFKELANNMDDVVKKTDDTVKAMERIWRSFSRDVKSAMKDLFKDLITGLEGGKDAWKNLWQNFGDVIVDAFRDAFARSLVEKMGFDKMFEGNILNLGNLFTGLGNVIAGVFKGVGNVIGSIFGAGGTATQAVVTGSTVAAEALKGTTAQMGIMAKVGLGLEKVILGFGNAFKYFATFGANATTIIGGITSGLAGMVGMIGTAYAGWQAFSYLAENVIGPVLSGLRKGLVKFFFGEDIRYGIKNLEQLAERMANAYQSAFAHISEHGRKTMNYLIDRGKKWGDETLFQADITKMSFEEAYDYIVEQSALAMKSMNTADRKRYMIQVEMLEKWKTRYDDTYSDILKITKEVAAGRMDIEGATTEEIILEWAKLILANDALADAQKSNLLEVLGFTQDAIMHMIANYEELYAEAERLAAEATEAQIQAYAELLAANNALTEEQKKNLLEILGLTQEVIAEMLSGSGWLDMFDLIEKRAKETWGAQGSLPIALSEAIKAMLVSIDTFPTRIDFDVVGNLHMPSIPSVGTQYFDVASAQGGIPYIPRTMPVVVHKKEAILTAPQAEAWRKGGGITTGNIIINLPGVKDPAGFKRLSPTEWKRYIDSGLTEGLQMSAKEGRLRKLKAMM